MNYNDETSNASNATTGLNETIHLDGSMNEPTVTNGSNDRFSSEEPEAVSREMVDSFDEEKHEATGWIDHMASVIGKEIKCALSSNTPAEERDNGGIPVKVFGGKKDEDVDEWFIKFEIAALAKGWSNRRKVERLPCYLDHHAFTTYLSASEEIKYDYEKLKTYLCDRYRPSNPFGFWRTQFRARKQAVSESVVSYADGLQAIVTKLKTYDPKNAVTDVELKEVFVQGLHPYYRQRMIGDYSIMTFSDAVRTARGLEEGYRAVHPERNEKLNRIGEPILDANAILEMNPKEEAELLGMHPEEVSRLLHRVHEQSQSRVLSDLTSNTVSAIVANKKTTQGSNVNDKLDRLERMIQNLENGNRTNRSGYGHPQRPFRNNRFSKRPGYLAAYEVRKRPTNDPIKCYNCDKLGHFAKDCYAPKRQYPVTRTPIGEQGKANRA